MVSDSWEDMTCVLWSLALELGAPVGNIIRKDVAMRQGVKTEEVDWKQPQLSLTVRQKYVLPINQTWATQEGASQSQLEGDLPGSPPGIATVPGTGVKVTSWRGDSGHQLDL